MKALLVLVLLFPAAVSPQKSPTKIPVLLSQSGDDQLGPIIAYKLKEIVSASLRYRLIDQGQEGALSEFYVFELISADPYKTQNSGVISYTVFKVDASRRSILMGHHLVYSKLIYADSAATTIMATADKNIEAQGQP